MQWDECFKNKPHFQKKKPGSPAIASEKLVVGSVALYARRFPDRCPRDSIECAVDQLIYNDLSLSKIMQINTNRFDELFRTDKRKKFHCHCLCLNIW